MDSSNYKNSASDAKKELAIFTELTEFSNFILIFTEKNGFQQQFSSFHRDVTVDDYYELEYDGSNSSTE
jgi:hypothetical protein